MWQFLIQWCTVDVPAGLEELLAVSCAFSIRSCIIYKRSLTNEYVVGGLKAQASRSIQKTVVVLHYWG
jgi:hypothetical protein